MTTVVTRTPREVYDLWLEALESGKYRQTQGTLKKVKKGHASFCCLGVLCDLARKDGGPAWGTHWDDYSYMGQPGTLPEKMLDYIGMSEDDCEELVVMNDSDHARFKTIAKHIRTNIIPKVFGEQQ